MAFQKKSNTVRRQPKKTKEPLLSEVHQRRVRLEEAEKGAGGYLVHVEDVTDRHRIEEDRRRAEEALRQRTLELQQVTETLEQRVLERTAELAKANLALKAEIEKSKLAEADLHKTTELLETVFSSVHILIAYMDNDFNFLRVNRAYAEADGRTPGFFTGKNHFILYPNAENEAIFRKVVETGRPHFVYEKPFVYAEHPERGVTYWDWSLQAVRDVEDTITGVVLSLVNVTERVRAEEALRQKEKLLKTVIETLPVGVWIIGKDGRILQGNPAGLEIWGGVKYVGINGYGAYKGWWVDSGKRIGAQEWSAARAITKGETSINEQIEIESFDGTRKIVLSSTVPIRDDNQEIIGAVVVNQDITELKRAGEALRESERQLRFLSWRLLSAQEEERKKIAHEIHDTLGASLSAIKYKIEGVSKNIVEEDGLAAMAGPLEEIIPLIQESMEECRRIQMDLRPSILDDLGLLATLSWFCRRFQAIYSGIHLEQEFAVNESEIPDPLKIVIYRVVQEAMNNIAKHSQAELARLSLWKTDCTIGLTLQDNGRGFDLKKALSVERRRRGLGLTSMRERVELSGGSYQIESVEGKGTIIRASWPVQENTCTAAPFDL
jgi:PAS domain S-box-containing protein